MPRRAKRVHTFNCLNCGVQFNPPQQLNYEHKKHRKTCSEECQYAYAAKKQRETVELKRRQGAIQQVRPARPAPAEPKQLKVVNVYKMVHQKAREFAGLGRLG